MKKLLKLALAGLLGMSLVACGSDTSANDSAAAPADAPESDVTRIALILPHIGDQSYMDVTAHSQALIEDYYGDAVEFNLIEMGDDSANWEAANRQAAEEGYDIIISGNWQYEVPMLAVAADYPEIKYLNFDYSDAEANSRENVYGITYASNQIGYLMGVVAGVKSQTGIIGGVLGQNNSGMWQFMAGYIQGAAEVNPDIKVMIASTDSYTDPAKAKEITENMIAEGVDIVWGCAGGSGNGVFEAISEHPGEGLWALGVDTDQYVSMSAKPEQQATILTSGLKNCDVSILNAVKSMIDGTVEYGTQKVTDILDGGVGIAENDYYKANMTEEEMARVNECIEKVKSGETVVVDELDPAQAGIYAELLAKYSK